MTERDEDLSLRDLLARASQLRDLAHRAYVDPSVQQELRDAYEAWFHAVLDHCPTEEHAELRQHRGGNPHSSFGHLDDFLANPGATSFGKPRFTVERDFESPLALQLALAEMCIMNPLPVDSWQRAINAAGPNTDALWVALEALMPDLKPMDNGLRHSRIERVVFAIHDVREQPDAEALLATMLAELEQVTVDTTAVQLVWLVLDPDGLGPTPERLEVLHTQLDYDGRTLNAEAHRVGAPTSKP